MFISENAHGEQPAKIAALFSATFTDSEGSKEGALVGDLATRILSTTPKSDIATFVAQDNNTLAGAIIFTRMRYTGGARSVWLLAPMAVAVGYQRQGIGQQLINTALPTLRQRGVEVVVTYGDPAFYGKTGFALIIESDVPAPFSLNMPEGWLGQSLTGLPIGQIKGPVQCVEALNDPAYW